LKNEKKDLFEQARDAPNDKERQIIIDTAAKLIPTEPQSVDEAQKVGKAKIEEAIAATSFGVAAAKPVPETSAPIDSRA